MLNRLLVVILVLSFPLTALAQVPDTLWTRYFFDDSTACLCRQVIETSDSGLALIGIRLLSPQDLGDISLIKTNANGDTLWTRRYGGDRVEDGYALHETPDHGFIIVGTTSQAYDSLRSVYLIKTDSLGNLTWSRTYGDTCNLDMESVDLSLDGGFIIAGSTNDWTYGNDIYVLKTDSLGNEDWHRAYEYSYGHGFSIRATADSGYVFAGMVTLGDTLPTRSLIMKLNSNGDTLRTRTYGHSLYGEEARAVVLTADGDYIMAGDSVGADGISDVAIRKFTTNGQLLWARLIEGQYMANSAYVTHSGDMLVSGFGYDSGKFTAFMAKTDSTGGLRWLKNFESDQQVDYDGRSIIETYDGGSVMLVSLSYPTTTHTMLVKLEPDDNQSADDNREQIPVHFILSQNYPNPFNGKCVIEYDLPYPSVAVLDIYNILGQKTATLADGYQLAGIHRVSWDAGQLPSGLYFYRLSSATFSETRKMRLLK